MAAAAVGVNDLLASAFTSSLGSTVVTYDQYQKEKKKDEAYFEPLDIDQLFQVTHLYGKFGEKDTSSVSSFDVYIKTLTGKTLTVEVAESDTRPSNLSHVQTWRFPTQQAKIPGDFT